MLLTPYPVITRAIAALVNPAENIKIPLIK